MTSGFDATGNGHPRRNGGPRVLRPLTGVALYALRPLNEAVGAAVDAAATLERRAVDRVLASGELERVMVEAAESPRIQTAVDVVLSSDAAGRLVDSFFDSGVFDRLVERLLASDALWRLVDELAQSPSVTAAVSQQGLGFADEVGEGIRGRSRNADDRLERAARRILRRHQPGSEQVAPAT